METATLALARRGGYSTPAMRRLTPNLLPDFEKDLDARRGRIAGGNFCGNEAVNGLVDAFLAEGRLPGRS